SRPEIEGRIVSRRMRFGRGFSLKAPARRRKRKASRPSRHQCSLLAGHSSDSACAAASSAVELGSTRRTSIPLSTPSSTPPLAVSVPPAAFQRRGSLALRPAPSSATILSGKAFAFFRTHGALNPDFRPSFEERYRHQLVEIRGTHPFAEKKVLERHFEMLR